MTNLKQEVAEEQSDEELDEAKQYEVGLIDDALGIITASKDLVSASAALQSEADRKLGIVPGSGQSVYIQDSDFNEGLVSAALEVVKAIGALKTAVADTVQGDISKEYLIVCAQHVKEKCVALEVASAVKTSESTPKTTENFESQATKLKHLQTIWQEKLKKQRTFQKLQLNLNTKFEEATSLNFTTIKLENINSLIC